MFSKIAFIAAAFVAVAVAVPTGETSTVMPASQCNVKNVQCCNTVQNANSAAGQKLLGLVGVAAGSVTGLVGATCTPVSVLAISGQSCSAQPVCCSNNNFNGLVAIGCTPVNLNA